MKTYYYFNDEKYSINVSDKTCELTPYTFQPNGELWENVSLQQFYNSINNNVEYNIVDVGAQSGLYSLFAKFLPKSTFYSFEPFTPTFNLLNENLILNNINNVKTHNIALSNTIGETTLNTCIHHNGLHTIGSNLKRFNDIKPITIKTTTLDDEFYNKNIPVDYIKIDTEGYEYWILKGGLKTIKEYKPIIQLEWNKINMEQCNVTEEMMKQLMDDIYYKDNSTNMDEEEKLFSPCL